MNKIVLFLIGTFLASSVLAQYHRVRPRPGCGSYDFVVETGTPPKGSIQDTSAVLGGSYLLVGTFVISHNILMGVEVSTNNVFPSKFKFSNPGTHMFPGNPFSGTVNGLAANTTYYFRAVVYAGSHGVNGYCPSYGKSIKIKTLPKKGGTPINNNIITSGNQVVCESGTSGLAVTLEGSMPTGGVGGTYTYTWQKLDTANTWQTASGTATDTNYTIAASTHAQKTKVSYRRKVVSGTHTDISAAVSVTYLPSSSSGKIDTVNIAQLPAGSDATTLVLVSAPIPVLGDHVTTWEKSTSYSSPFNDMPGQQGSSSLIVKNPDTAMRYRTTVIYHNGAIGSCAVGRSPDIGFTPEDGNGNIYPTVKIDSTVWMIQNLRATSFNDGTAIPVVTSDTSWKSRTQPAYCWYNNSSGNAIRDGALYNSYVITSSTKNICPVGWHVATSTDWTNLITKLGSATAGKKLKTTSGWFASAGNTGTNAYNFNALPAGYRSHATGSYAGKQTFGMLWNDMGSSSIYATRKISYNTTTVTIQSGASSRKRDWGASIRCVKD